MNIKAIETKYGGYRFRSRLEARWAVFFDSLGIEWEYEKQGFDLGGVRYLPDFWLATVSMWAEVKPDVEFDKAANILVTQLAHLTNNPVLMLGGTPAFRPYKAAEPTGGTYCYLLSNYHNYPKTEHRFYGNPTVADFTWDDFLMCGDSVGACEAAKSARFEFGEHGAR